MMLEAQEASWDDGAWIVDCESHAGASVDVADRLCQLGSDDSRWDPDDTWQRTDSLEVSIQYSSSQVPQWRRRSSTLSSEDDTWQRTDSLEISYQRGSPEPQWRRRPKIGREGIVVLGALLRGGVYPASTKYLVQDGACQTDETHTGDSCAICLLDNSTHAFSPCGHLCLCEACAQKIGARQCSKRCPICRNPANSIVKIRFGYENVGSLRDSVFTCEWRRDAALAQSGYSRKSNRRLQSEGALASLQHILFENTTKQTLRRCCPTADGECQTVDSCMKCFKCSMAVTCAILPCGHYCVCVGCADAGTIDSCPFCRTRAVGFVRVYT